MLFPRLHGWAGVSTQLGLNGIRHEDSKRQPIAGRHRLGSTKQGLRNFKCCIHNGKETRNTPHCKQILTQLDVIGLPMLCYGNAGEWGQDVPTTAWDKMSQPRWV